MFVRLLIDSENFCWNRSHYGTFNYRGIWNTASLSRQPSGVDRSGVLAEVLYNSEKEGPLRQTGLCVGRQKCLGGKSWAQR